MIFLYLFRVQSVLFKNRSDYFFFQISFYFFLSYFFIMLH